jgi:hypothetical protein
VSTYRAPDASTSPPQALSPAPEHIGDDPASVAEVDTDSSEHVRSEAREDFDSQINPFEDQSPASGRPPFPV